MARDDFGHHCEGALLGRGTKYRLSEGWRPLTYRRALELLGTEQAFGDYLTRLLAGSEYRAFRWETPPIARDTVERPFEFVLVSDPLLDMDPEPDVFGPYFAGAHADVTVLAVPNLTHTATMVVPRPIADHGAYVHIAAFVRRAPPAQVAALWRCVAAAATVQLTAAPIWISTAGGGVAWLHVRIDETPKYYAFRPYAIGA